MPEVTPGYRFGLDEVPSYAKFIAQAKNLSLTGLDPDDLSDSLKQFYNGSESGGSGASQPFTQEAAIYGDKHGEVWVSQRTYGWWGSSGYSGPEHVLVPLFRPFRGGWASIRLGKRNTGGNAVPGRGVRAENSQVGANYSPTSLVSDVIVWDHDLSTAGPREAGWLDYGSGASGTYRVYTGRGLGYLGLPGTSVGSLHEQYSVRADDSTNYQPFPYQSGAANPPVGFGLVGLVIGPPPIGGTVLGNDTISQMVWAWYFGRHA